MYTQTGSLSLSFFLSLYTDRDYIFLHTDIFFLYTDEHFFLFCTQTKILFPFFYTQTENVFMCTDGDSLFIFLLKIFLKLSVSSLSTPEGTPGELRGHAYSLDGVFRHARFILLLVHMHASHQATYT